MVFLVFLVFLVCENLSQNQGLGLGRTKTLKKKMVLNILSFFACSIVRPILVQFWVDSGSPNRPKIGPERVFKGVENHDRFSMLFRTSKNRFLGQHGPNMARFWSPRWPQVGSKMESKSVQKRSRKRGRLRNRFGDDSGSILGRSWVDFGTILDRFCIDFGFDFG